MTNYIWSGGIIILDNDLIIEFLSSLARIHNTDNLSKICELENMFIINRKLHSDIKFFLHFEGDFKFLFVNNFCTIEKVC